MTEYVLRGVLLDAIKTWQTVPEQQLELPDYFVLQRILEPCYQSHFKRLGVLQTRIYSRSAPLFCTTWHMCLTVAHFGLRPQLATNRQLAHEIMEYSQGAEARATPKLFGMSVAYYLKLHYLQSNLTERSQTNGATQMTNFNVHTIETAGDSKPLLEKSKKAHGFVPNLHGVMAESPALLEAYQTVSAIFDNKTNLNTTEQQIIAMTNNRLNGCTYCMAGHTSIMQAAKVPEDVITALRDGTPIADPKLEALRVFAEKVNVNRGRMEDSDIEALLAAGYTKQTVFDVVVGTAYKVLSNYTNHIADTPLDKAFAKNEWSPEAQPVG